MYISPIEIKVLDDFEMTLEKNVVKVVQHYGITVERDELIRALRYDREQYDRGYEDGIANVPRWIPLSEALPEDGTWNLFTDGRRISLERYKQDAEDHFYPAGRYFDLTEAVAWMELPKQAWTLPEPWEGEKE